MDLDFSLSLASSCSPNAYLPHKIIILCFGRRTFSKRSRPWPRSQIQCCEVASRL